MSVQLNVEKKFISHSTICYNRKCRFFPDEEQRADIRNALRHWSAETCLEFQEIDDDIQETSNDAGVYDDDNDDDYVQQTLYFTNADNRYQQGVIIIISVLFFSEMNGTC